MKCPKYTKEIAKNNAVGKGGAGGNLKDAGTGTGLNGDTYGANISPDATNTIGPLNGAGSAKPDETCPGEC